LPLLLKLKLSKMNMLMRKRVTRLLGKQLHAENDVRRQALMRLCTVLML
jgi:hypothetical protein